MYQDEHQTIYQHHPHIGLLQKDTLTSIRPSIIELCCFIVCDFTCDIAKCFVLLLFSSFCFVICVAFYRVLAVNAADENRHSTGTLEDAIP